jgi:hypothetical protein
MDYIRSGGSRLGAAGLRYLQFKLAFTSLVAMRPVDDRVVHVPGACRWWRTTDLG